MLEYIITSKAKRSLLKLLLTNPDAEFYVREISRRIGEPLNAVRRELGYLEKAGLIKARHAGNLKYYSVVKEFPIYPELKKIIFTTIGFGDYLTERFKDSKQIELAFIYGSVAKDEETAKSDVDLFIVGAIDADELHELVSRIEKDMGRVINYTIMSKAEFNNRLKNSNPFIKRVMKDKKLILKGNHDFN
jgi:predicted transcriptional regulator